MLEDLRPLYRQLGIDLAAHNGEANNEHPVTPTYVIDQDQIVRWAFVEANFTQHADPLDVIAVLKEIQTRMIA